MSDQLDPNDDRLRNLLKVAKPVRELPPGFQRQVWQRLDQPETKPAFIWSWLGSWLLNPRIAVAALAAMLVLAAGLGTLRGFHAGDALSRDRYLASVDPNHFGR